MKLLLALYVSTFLILSCSLNKKTQETIRLELTYNLINEILSDSTDVYLKNINYCLSEMTLLIPDTFNPEFNAQEFYKNLFDEDDTVNIYQQLDFKNEFLMDSLKIQKMKILSANFIENENFTESFWNYIRENCSGGYITFSKPVFSKDNSLVYLKFGYTCGRLCGAGESRLYKRENGKWILVKSVSKWIS